MIFFLVSHAKKNIAPASSSSSRTRTPKITSSASWDSAPKASHQEISSGSWASIASSKQQEEALKNEDLWNDNTTTDETNANDDWAAPTYNTTTTTTNDDNNSTEDQPKTWASLLK